MWPSQFEDRLQAWTRLRSSIIEHSLEQTLLEVNEFWKKAPWCPYYLHPDDLERWPTPWELLSDNIYCGLAKALGIAYTLLLIRDYHPDIADIEIVVTDQDNLVLINKGLYILNCEIDVVLNTDTVDLTKIKKRISESVLQNKLN